MAERTAVNETSERAVRCNNCGEWNTLNEYEHCENCESTNVTWFVVEYALTAARRDAFEEAAKIAEEYTCDRPHMPSGPLKDEWENGVADASIGIAAALRARMRTP